MTGRSKALVFIGGVFFVLVGGVALIMGIAWAANRHVPGNTLLAFDISWSIPESTDEGPFGDLFGTKTLSRRDLRDALKRAASDPSVRGVRVKINDLQAGFATVQEVRTLLRAVSKAGKPTWAFMDTAGEGTSGSLQYYLATGCDKVVLGPMGDLNLIGLAARRPFIRGTLDKLGIEPEFIGIGDYKTARFFYTEKDFTPADREMTGWLLDSVMGQLQREVTEARKIEPGGARALLTGGPYGAEDAKAAKLVDKVSTWSDFVEETESQGGTDLTPVSLKRYLRAGRPDDSGATVAVVLAEGAIVRGESGYSPVPLFGGDMMGAETIAKAFRRAREAKPKAVIFRINSPGGSAIASEIIRVEMLRTAKEIPVVVSMGDVAASGGYWVTCGASKIVADPGTITASIGVFGGHFAMERFWTEKLGVTWGKLDRGDANATLYGALEPWTPGQRATQQKWIDTIYSQFLDRVATARKLTREQVDAIARGRVFTGEQAIKHGLVDVLGDFDVALAEAKKLAKLKADDSVDLQFYPRSRPLWQRLMERDDTRANLSAALKAIAEGRIQTPGPVWMPPLEIQ